MPISWPKEHYTHGPERQTKRHKHTHTTIPSADGPVSDLMACSQGWEADQSNAYTLVPLKSKLQATQKPLNPIQPANSKNSFRIICIWPFFTYTHTPAMCILQQISFCSSIFHLQYKSFPNTIHSMNFAHSLYLHTDNDNIQDTHIISMLKTCLEGKWGETTSFIRSFHWLNAFSFPFQLNKTKQHRQQQGLHCFRQRHETKP